MTTKNLPLKTITFDIFIRPEEADTGKEFPPSRFKTRDTRLDDYDDIMEADFTKYVEDAEDVALPLATPRKLVMTPPNILLASKPEAAYPLRHVASDALRDMLAYGGAVILAYAGANGPQINTISPLSWYPTMDGGAILITPFISDEAESDMPDRVEIVVAIDGSVEKRVHEWEGYLGTRGTIGKQIESEVLGSGGVVISPRAPQLGIWGESVLPDLISPALEISRRFTQNSRVLDENADPVLTWFGTNEDFRLKFPSLLPNPTQADREAAISAGLIKERKKKNLVINSPTQKVAYLEYSGNLMEAFEQVKVGRELNSLFSGVPALLESMSQPPASGVSLRLLFYPFYMATTTLQDDLKEKLGYALELAGLDPAINWMHVFDVMDAERQAELVERRVGIRETS